MRLTLLAVTISYASSLSLKAPRRRLMAASKAAVEPSFDLDANAAIRFCRTEPSAVIVTVWPTAASLKNEVQKWITECGGRVVYQRQVRIPKTGAVPTMMAIYEGALGCRLCDCVVPLFVRTRARTPTRARAHAHTHPHTHSLSLTLSHAQARIGSIRIAGTMSRRCRVGRRTGRLQERNGR